MEFISKKRLIYFLIPLIFSIHSAGCRSLSNLHQNEKASAHWTDADDDFHQAQMARRAEVLRMLSADDRQIRERAAIELLSMGDKHSLDVLKEKLTGPADPEIKVDIINAIAFRADRRCFDYVLNALSDPHSQVRTAAADALSNFSKPHEIEAVIEYIEAADLAADDLQAIYETFGKGLFVKATPILIDGLDNENASVKETAWESLRKIWDRDLPPSVEEWKEFWHINRHRSRAEILEERLRATQVSLNALRHRVRDVERELGELAALAMSDKRRNAKDLFGYLDSDKTRVMEFAAFSVSNMSKDDLSEINLDNRELYIKLRNIFRSSDTEIVKYIARILDKLEGRHRNDLLIEALDQQQPAAVIRDAISAIKEPPSEKIVGKLEELIRHSTPRVREAAANALSKSTKESSIAALRNALKDDEANVRWFAVESLRKQDAKSALPDIIELLQNDPSPLVREICATTLAQFVQPASFPALRQALQDESRRVRDQALRALTALAKSNPDRTLTIGKALIENSFFDEAISIIDFAIEESEVYENGEELLKQATELKFLLADKLFTVKKFSRAKEVYSELVSLDEYAELSRKKIISVHIALEEYDKIIDQFADWFEDEIDDDIILLQEGLDCVRKLIEAEIETVAIELAEFLNSVAMDRELETDEIDSVLKKLKNEIEENSHREDTNEERN